MQNQTMSDDKWAGNVYTLYALRIADAILEYGLNSDETRRIIEKSSTSLKESLGHNPTNLRDIISGLDKEVSDRNTHPEMHEPNSTLTLTEVLKKTGIKTTRYNEAWAYLRQLIDVKDNRLGEVLKVKGGYRVQNPDKAVQYLTEEFKIKGFYLDRRERSAKPNKDEVKEEAPGSEQVLEKKHVQGLEDKIKEGTATLSQVLIKLRTRSSKWNEAQRVVEEMIKSGDSNIGQTYKIGSGYRLSASDEVLNYIDKRLKESGLVATNSRNGQNHALLDDMPTSLYVSTFNLENGKRAEAVSCINDLINLGDTKLSGKFRRVGKGYSISKDAETRDYIESIFKSRGIIQEQTRNKPTDESLQRTLPRDTQVKEINTSWFGSTEPGPRIKYSEAESCDIKIDERNMKIAEIALSDLRQSEERMHIIGGSSIKEGTLKERVIRMLDKAVREKGVYTGKNHETFRYLEGQISVDFRVVNGTLIDISPHLSFR